jgi:hypothetical protein
MKNSTFQYLVIICILLSANISFAQEGTFLESQFFVQDDYNFTDRKLDYSKIKGSPFLSEEMKQGVIVFENGNQLTDIPMRFNLNENSFEFTYKGKTQYLSKTQRIQKVVFEGNDYVIKKLPGDKADATSFVRKLGGDKIEFFVYEYTKYNAEVKSNNPYERDEPANFSRNEDRFFMSKDNGPLIEFKSRKALQSGLEEFGVDVKAYFKQEKPSHKDESDLKKLLEFINK